MADIGATYDGEMAEIIKLRAELENAEHYRDKWKDRHSRLQVDMEAKDERIAELEGEVARLRNCVPDTWLDSLLSGPDAVATIGSCGCPNTEKLLQAISKRMAAPEGD